MVRRGKGGALTFFLDGVDRTTQDVRLTQAEIEAVLGTSLLGRTVFYGQSEITALLESNDRVFKEELGKIVDLEVWAAAKEASKKSLSAVKMEVTEVEAKVGVKQQYVAQQRADIDALEVQRRAVMAEREEQRARGRQQIVAVGGEVVGARAHLVECAYKALAYTINNKSNNKSTFGGDDASTTTTTTTTTTNQVLEQLTAELSSLEKGNAAAQVRRGVTQAAAIAKRRLLEDFLSLHTTNQTDAAAVCDRCFQPISVDQISTTADMLAEEHDLAAVAAEEADVEARAAERAVAAVATLVHAARQEQMQDMRAAAAAEAEASELMGAFERGCDEVERLLESSQRVVEEIVNEIGLEEQQQGGDSNEGDAFHVSLGMVSRYLSECTTEKGYLFDDGGGAKVVLLEENGGSGGGGGTPSSFPGGSGSLDDGFLHTTTTTTTPITSGGGNRNTLGSLPQQQHQPHHHLESSLGNETTTGEIMNSRDAALLLQTLRKRVDACSAAVTKATRTLSDFKHALRNADSIPLDDELCRRREWLVREESECAGLECRREELSVIMEDLRAVDDAFKPTGIVSYVLEGALGALQQAANNNLAMMAPGVTLELTASRPRSATSELGTIEQVQKQVFVRVPGSPTELRQRSVKQLSGGERRRVALALALGFTELASRRGRMRCDLLVLDEVMQHLDGDGCARFAGLLRGLDQFGTVLVVAQAQSFLTRAFDAVDVVVKGEGGSSVVD